MNTKISEKEDHEVGMAMNQLEAIFTAVQDLEDKIAKDGFEERNLPGWIQSHITSAYEYIKQANDNFHELEEGAMGDVTLPTDAQVGSGDVPAGKGDAEERYKKKMKNTKTFEEFVNESYDGQMSDFKYEYPMRFEEETGNSPKAIKKMSKKGKGYEVRTSSYMSREELERVGLSMGLTLKDYKKSNIVIAIYE